MLVPEVAADVCLATLVLRGWSSFLALNASSKATDSIFVRRIPAILSVGRCSEPEGPKA